MRVETLRRSLVVPHDIFATKHDDLLPEIVSKESSVDALPGGSFPLNTEKYSLLPSCGPLADDSSSTSLSQTRQIHRLISDDGSVKPRPIVGASVFGNSIEIARSSRHREPSWFPAVDDLVATRFASAGGPRGVLTSWILTSSSQTVGEHNVIQEAGSQQSTVIAPRVFTFYKLRYQVSGNRWCRNVQRAHRSNGVALEVDLTRKEVTQTCWDADCRRFRSAPEDLFVDIPIDAISWMGLPLDPDALHKLMVDKCATEVVNKTA
jgi:hypothetical protein